MKFQTRTDWHGRVDQAVKRLLNSLDDPLSFRDIASEVASSPYHFHRMFRKLTGETVQACFKRLRLERAMTQLRTSTLPITTIAFKAGYQTLEGFIKALKTKLGLTPSQFRKLASWKGHLFSQAGIHFQPDGPQGQWFFLKKGENMEVKIVTLPSKQFVCLRNVGDYWKIPQRWTEFHKLLGSNKLYWEQAQFMIIFHDHHDQVPMKQKRSDVAMTINTDIGLPGKLFPYESPPGLYAVTPHFGSCEEIGDTWDRWRTEWLPSSGWKLDRDRPCFEWYQNMHLDPPPELLLTFLCDPVVKEKEVSD